MELKELDCYECTAVEAVVNVINGAKQRLGERTSLHKLLHTRYLFRQRVIVPIPEFREPAVNYGLNLIKMAIEKHWRLVPQLMYTLRYVDTKIDYVSHLFYYEAIFSQPTSKYPIPQATVSVFFTMLIKRLGPANRKEVPKLTYKLEGHTTDHDFKYEKLVADWILGVLQMKIKIFKRIEAINMF